MRKSSLKKALSAALAQLAVPQLAMLRLVNTLDQMMFLVWALSGWLKDQVKDLYCNYYALRGYEGLVK